MKETRCSGPKVHRKLENGVHGAQLETRQKEQGTCRGCQSKASHRRSGHPLLSPFVFPSWQEHAAAKAVDAKQAARMRLAQKHKENRARQAADPARQDRHRDGGQAVAEGQVQGGGGRQGGFTAGAVVVLMALVSVLMLAEWRRRDGYHKHRSVGTHPCVGHAPMFFSGPVRLRCR